MTTDNVFEPRRVARRRQRRRDRMARARDARRHGPTGRPARGRRARDQERQDRARGVLLQSRGARRMTLTRTATLAVNDATYVAWNAHDPDAVAAVFAEDAVLREAGRPDEVRGRAAIRERAAMLLRGFSDFRLERLTLVIDGDAHADRWVMTGTHDGELYGIAPTGRPRADRGRHVHPHRLRRLGRRGRALHRHGGVAGAARPRMIRVVALAIGLGLRARRRDGTRPSRRIRQLARERRRRGPRRARGRGGRHGHSRRRRRNAPCIPRPSPRSRARWRCSRGSDPSTASRRVSSPGPGRRRRRARRSRRRGVRRSVPRRRGCLSDLAPAARARRSTPSTAASPSAARSSSTGSAIPRAKRLTRALTGKIGAWPTAPGWPPLRDAALTFRARASAKSRPGRPATRRHRSPPLLAILKALDGYSNNVFHLASDVIGGPAAVEAAARTAGAGGAPR